jgi:hypothetical protein
MTTDGTRSDRRMNVSHQNAGRDPVADLLDAAAAG